MSAVKKVEEAVEGAVKRRKKQVKRRKKQLKKAQNLRDKGKKKPAGQKRKAAQTERAQTRTNVRTSKTDGMGGRQTQTMTDEENGVQQTTTRDIQATRTETPQEQPDGVAVDNAQTSDAPVKEQVAQSGGKYDPNKFLEMAKDKNLGRSERWMLKRLGNMRANAQKVFDKGTDEQIKNELGRWGIEAKEGATADGYMKDIDEILKKKAENGPTLGDKFRSHHGVGLTGLGVVGVSTLDLASSHGQQSNAQLYSDPFA